MRRLRIILFAAAAGLFATAGRPVVLAASPTTQQFIEQLNSDDPAQRTAAEDHLANAGKAVMESLHQAARDANPETRVRALRALRRIELFRLRDVPTQQLAIADAYLDAADYGNRRLQLNLLLESQPDPDEVLTRLVPIENDPELRRAMLYKLFVGYRPHVARIIDDDDDIDALLTLLDGAACGGAQRPAAADDAAAIYLTGHVDEQIARWTAEQTNGTTADQEGAGTMLCYLYRVTGNHEQALHFARLSREQPLIFLCLADQANWTAAANEPDDRWHDPLLSAAYRACFLRLAGQQSKAIDLLTPLANSAAADADASFSPSKLFLLNDLPEAGLNLLLPRHPAVAFSMRVERGEIPQAIEIAERFPNDTDMADRLLALKQSLGEAPPPTTQPTEAENNGPDWIPWQNAVVALQNKNDQSAADQFGKMWAGDHSHCDRLYLQGYALKAAGQTAVGEAMMHKAELIPLGDTLARWRLAAQLDAAGLPDDAERQRVFGLQTGADFDEVGISEIWNTKAANAVAAHNWKDAADALDRLCLINLSSAVQWHDPQRFLTVPALAHLCHARDAQAHGDLSTALVHLQLYQQYLPASSELALEWVPILDDLGQHAKADELFNGIHDKLVDICKKYPKSRTYLNSVAWMSACCGRRLDEAQQYAQTAVDLKPDDYQTLDTLAETHFRRGDRQTAIALETRAIALDPDPYIQRQLKRFQTASVPSTTQPGAEPQ